MRMIFNQRFSGQASWLMIYQGVGQHPPLLASPLQAIAPVSCHSRRISSRTRSRVNEFCRRFPSCNFIAEVVCPITTPIPGEEACRSTLQPYLATAAIPLLAHLLAHVFACEKIHGVDNHYPLLSHVILLVGVRSYCTTMRKKGVRKECWQEFVWCQVESYRR